MNYATAIKLNDPVEWERVMLILKNSKTCSVLGSTDEFIEFKFLGTSVDAWQLGVKIGECLQQIRGIRQDQIERSR